MIDSDRSCIVERSLGNNDRHEPCGRFRMNAGDGKKWESGPNYVSSGDLRETGALGQNWDLS